MGGGDRVDRYLEAQKPWEAIIHMERQKTETGVFKERFLSALIWICEYEWS